MNNLTPDAAVLILTTALESGAIAGRSVDFAQSLVRQHASDRGLSDKQAYWAIKLATDASTPRAAPVSVPNIAPLLSGAKGRYPKLAFDLPAGKVVLKLAGERSKYAGDVMVTDGGPFGAIVWHGRIDSTGAFHASRTCAEHVAPLLEALDIDPARAMAQYGHESGNCCMCGREITHPASLAVGYGPVCADNYGLPYAHEARAEACA